MKEKTTRVKTIEPCVIVHGGAGTIPASREEGKLNGVKKSARVGYRTLIETESAIKAVEKAVNVMERDEYFNAGYGSVLTSEGNVEMDASIMCGRTLNFGCVSLVTDILHPISLARVVMQKSKYKFLSEEGAKKFARQNGIRILHPPGQLVTDFTSNFMQSFVAEQHLKTDKSKEKVFEAVSELQAENRKVIDFSSLADRRDWDCRSSCNRYFGKHRCGDEYRRNRRENARPNRRHTNNRLRNLL